ncbi:B-cell receptor CD22-like [Alosa pseudoharengus]|uniref:B-cell receptor CD22-like n=1 Tax=Alosa pseudoharengus TaxID=34774 RepID=UPI003F8C7E2C
MFIRLYVKYIGMMAGLLHTLAKLLMFVILKDAQSAINKKDWVNITHQHICALTGSSVVMPCSLIPPAGQTVTKVFWVIYPKEGVEPPDLYGNPSYTGRVQYYWDKNTNKNNCTLKLTGVKGTDSSEYKVRIIAKGHNNKWLSHGVGLSVTGLTVQVPDSVVEGCDVKMSCRNNCTWKSKPTVIWRKDGTDLPPDRIKNSELLFTSVRKDDEGNYSCALKGHEGHPSKPRKLIVMFSPKNISVSFSPAGETLEGASVTLTCSSDANPPVENYTWFKVNESTAVGSGQQYSITNIRSEDGGQYYCEARNKYGAENSTAVLITVVGMGIPLL